MENDVQAFKAFKNVVHREANAKAVLKLDFSPLINDNVKYSQANSQANVITCRTAFGN